MKTNRYVFSYKNFSHKNFTPMDLAFLSFLLPLLFLFTGCGRQAEPITRQGFYFDTVIQITIYGTKDESLLEECFSMAQDYENMFSKTVENSDIWNINHADGSPVKVSEDTLTLLRTSLYYAGLTEGKIDPTIGIVSGLWDFTDTSSAVIPQKEQLNEALSHVGYHNIHITGNTVNLSDSHAEIDLGFIAKGYIADRMKEYLISQGVKNAIINLGGNVLTIGGKPDGTPFQVGIQKPFAAGGTTAFILPVTDLSVVSSGIYERFFLAEDEIYHHILDTKTGYPVRNNLFGVTILSDSSMEGDALSTTCFILGMEEGMALIESLDDTEAVFITSDGEIHVSSGLTGITHP